MKRFISVITQFIGFHHYEDAPPAVAFLHNMHRHKFFVKVIIETFSNDRELEFFIVQKELENIVDVVKVEDKSCEAYAEAIYDWLKKTYGKRMMQVEVSEDNENAGIVGDLYD